MKPKVYDLDKLEESIKYKEFIDKLKKDLRHQDKDFLMIEIVWIGIGILACIYSLVKEYL